MFIWAKRVQNDILIDINDPLLLLHSLLQSERKVLPIFAIPVLSWTYQQSIGS
jgi:hypothetical protein